eukprot:355246-Chlamydomonas_euryale.AAC.1
MHPGGRDPVDGMLAGQPRRMCTAGVVASVEVQMSTGQGRTRTPRDRRKRAGRHDPPARTRAQFCRRHYSPVSAKASRFQGCAWDRATAALSLRIGREETHRMGEEAHHTANGAACRRMAARPRRLCPLEGAAAAIKHAIFRRLCIFQSKAACGNAASFYAQADSPLTARLHYN